MPYAMNKILNCCILSVFIMAAFGCGQGQPVSRPPIRAGAGRAGAPEPGLPAAAVSMPDAVRLTEGIEYESSPCWSPDGTNIAYSSYSGGSQNIWIRPLDYHAENLAPSGEPEQITSGEFLDRDPSWSAEGNRIVFSSDRGGDFKLFLVDLDTRDPDPLDVEGIQPRWSPGGDRIAFVSKNNISVIQLNDSSEKVVLTTSGYNEFPSWAPDGGNIAFSSGYNIIRMDDTGSSRRNLTASAWNSQADWCRSRDRIVFVSNRSGQYNLWKMNADGSGKTQLTDTENVERFPRWSHDGRWVAFQSDYKGSFDVWAIKVD